MARFSVICKTCGKVQAVVDQDNPVPLAPCNDPNNSTCRRAIAAAAKKAQKAAANKRAEAGENKSMAPGADGLADLDGMKVTDLKDMCNTLGLTGYTKMKKDELIALIFQANKAGAA